MTDKTYHLHDDYTKPQTTLEVLKDVIEIISVHYTDLSHRDTHLKSVLSTIIFKCRKAVEEIERSEK